MIKGYSKYNKLGEELEGLYTVETLCKKLGIKRNKAIYLIYRLRKLGFVKTIYGAGKERVYRISTRNKRTGISYTDKINKVSPIKLVASDPYYVHGRTPSYEEALVYAIKQRDIRYLIASLILFRKITNWSLLYKLAKKEKLIREIVALYEISRKIINKVRRIPKRFLSQAEKEKSEEFLYIVPPYSSDDFTNIESKWRVYIPLNYADLEDYKR